MTLIMIKPTLEDLEAGARAQASIYVPIGRASWGPVYAIGGSRGGAAVEFVVGDDDGDDPEFDDEDGDDGDEDDEYEFEPARGDRRAQRGKGDQEGDDWEPPTREAWASVEQALKRANNEAAKRRHLTKAAERLGVRDAEELSEFLLSRGIDPTTGSRLDVDDADGGDGGEHGDEAAEAKQNGNRKPERKTSVADIRRAEQRGAARTEERLLPALVSLAAQGALRDAGLTGDGMARVVRLIDQSKVDIEFDDDGELSVSGLDEQVEELKADFPQLFAQKAPPAPTRRRSARDVDGGSRGRGPSRPVSWQEQIADQLRGATGR